MRIAPSAWAPQLRLSGRRRALSSGRPGDAGQPAESDRVRSTGGIGSRGPALTTPTESDQAPRARRPESGSRPPMRAANPTFAAPARPRLGFTLPGKANPPRDLREWSYQGGFTLSSKENPTRAK